MPARTRSPPPAPAWAAGRGPWPRVLATGPGHHPGPARQDECTAGRVCHRGRLHSMTPEHGEPMGRVTPAPGSAAHRVQPVSGAPLDPWMLALSLIHI